MADVLRIRLESPQCEVGGKVAGTVYVDQALDKCDRLDVYLQYSGKRLAGSPIARKSLQRGSLSAGQSLPFELRIPRDAPFSFTGHAHSVEWKVVARADVPWAIDPKTHSPITVHPKAVENTPEAIAAATDLPPVAKKKTVVSLPPSSGCLQLCYWPRWPPFYLWP